MKLLQWCKANAMPVIAALASLITFWEYTKHVKGQTGRFLALFSIISFGFIAILLTAMILWS